MVDINKLLTQAQEMQSQLSAKEEEIANKEFIGKSGGDLVEITCTGKGDLKDIFIDPSIIKPENAVLIKDLIIAAFSDAKRKAEVDAASSINNIFSIIPK
jgi:DNA-binding YbaB/EbfC family protein